MVFDSFDHHVTRVHPSTPALVPTFTRMGHSHQESPDAPAAIEAAVCAAEAAIAAVTAAANSGNAGGGIAAVTAAAQSGHSALARIAAGSNGAPELVDRLDRGPQLRAAEAAVPRRPAVHPHGQQAAL